MQTFYKFAWPVHAPLAHMASSLRTAMQFKPASTFENMCKRWNDRIGQAREALETKQKQMEEDEEDVGISGSSQRFLLMQKLQRKAVCCARKSQKEDACMSLVNSAQGLTIWSACDGYTVHDQVRGEVIIHIVLLHVVCNFRAIV